MVHRQHGRGTLYIDRRFSRVLGRGPQCRIQIASGTLDAELFGRINVMLDIFAERRPELLEEIRDGRITPLQAYRHFSTGQWERIPVGKHLRPLAEALNAWAARGRVAEKTADERRRWVRTMLKLAKNGATIDVLPELLERYRETCEDDDTASTFNKARKNARAFLRDTVKKSDRLYREVVDVATLKETPKLGRRPQTPDGARQVARAMSAEAGAIWLSLCYTGMNLKEYYRDGWEIDYDLGAVRIHGKKREARERLVPLLVAPAVPQLQRQGFRSAMRRAKQAVTPHDARRTYRLWLQGAGIDKAHRDYYAGHAAETMEELYTQPGQNAELIRSWLEADRPKLLAYLKLERGGLEVVGA